MEFLDFEIEVGPLSGGTYPVEVRSPAGEARASMRFPYDSLALKVRLQALQIALLSSPGIAQGRRRVLNIEEQPVQEFGQALFEALLDGPLRTRYVLSRDKAVSEGKGLRLKLRMDAPELAVLPWEYLYDPDQDEYVCLSRNTPLVRYLEIPQSIQSLTVKPPLRILGMLAAPSDLPALDVQRERQRMEIALSGLQATRLISLEWLPGGTWRHLQTAMAAGPWHIFHFIGHGGFDQPKEGFIALEDEDTGRSDPLGATQLALLLADHNPLRLVLLNACASAQGSNQDVFASTAATLVRRGIPAVVAMQYEITDRAAIEFGQSFYSSVARAMPVDAAVAEARKSVRIALDNTLEWGTPVLHMRSPDGVLFQVQATDVLPVNEVKVSQLEKPDGPAKKEGADEPTAVERWLKRIKSVAEHLTAATAAVTASVTVFLPPEAQAAKPIAGGIVVGLLALLGGLSLYRQRRAVTTRGGTIIDEPRIRPRWIVALTAALLVVLSFQFVPSLVSHIPVPQIGGPAQSSGTRWTTAAEMLVSRNEVAGAALWGKIYVAGTESNSRASGALGEYDPTTDRWTEIDPPPEAGQVRFAGLAAAKGRLYLVGGFSGEGQGLDTAWAFDPVERRWETLPRMGQGRGSMAVLAAGDKIYVIGGRTRLLGDGDVGTAEVYDPDTNRWTRLPDMPTPRNHVAAATHDGKVYVIGGRSGSFSDKEADHLATVEEYDPVARSWRRRADMLSFRSGFAAAAVGNAIYLFAGEGSFRDQTGEAKVGILNRTEAFDPALNTWTSKPEMPTSRHGYAAVALDGQIYVIGGGLAAGGGASRFNERFVP